MGIKDTNFDAFPENTTKRPTENLDFDRTDSELAFSNVVKFLRRMSELNERITDLTAEFKDVYKAYQEAMSETKHGVNIFEADSERLYAKVLGHLDENKCLPGEGSISPVRVSGRSSI